MLESNQLSPAHEAGGLTVFLICVYTYFYGTEKGMLGVEPSPQVYKTYILPLNYKPGNGLERS